MAENGKERYFTVNLADESESDINPVSLGNLTGGPERPRESEEIAASRPLWMIFVLLGCGLLMIEWYAWLKLNPN